MTVAELFEDYDWQEAFKYETSAAIPNDNISTNPVQITDVEEVLYESAGENDGPDWIGIFRLKDGRFAAVEAWCDYTGWGCQDGGATLVAKSLEELIRFGLSESARERFGLQIDGEEKRHAPGHRGNDDV